MAVDFVDLGLQAGGVIIIVVLVAIVAAAVVFGIIYRKKNKLYSKNKVIVWRRYKSKDGSEVPIIEDLNEKGAVIKDKVMNKFVFHLKNANLDMGEEELDSYDEDREMDIPSVPHGKGGDVVFVEKIGNRKYAFGEPFIINGKVKIRVAEADLAEAKRSYAIFVKTFSKKPNPLWAFGLYVVFAVLILVLVFVVLNKFELIAEASKNFATGAQAVGRGAAIPSSAPG